MSATRRSTARLVGSPIAWISFLVILATASVAVFGPHLAGLDEFQMSAARLRAPSSAAWLGTDELGRGVATQLAFGSRTSLLVGLVAAFSATVVGIVIGALAGFAGTRLDNVIMRTTEMFQVLPSFVLAAVIVAFWGPGLTRVIFVIAFLSWPQTARLARGEVIRMKSLGYVDAARCLGMTETAILWREIIPNSLAPVLTVGTLIIGQAILLEAGLAFFGLTSPDVASWGKMLNSGQRYFHQAWWLSIFPGLAIFLVVLSFNLLGDKLTEAFNPRSGNA